MLGASWVSLNSLLFYGLFSKAEQAHSTSSDLKAGDLPRSKVQFPSNHMTQDMTSPRVRAYLLNEVVSFKYKIWRQLLFKLIILPSVTESILLKSFEIWGFLWGTIWI